MTLAQLYESLTSLPLFKGISAKELSLIADKVHLRWMTIGSDHPFIQSEEPCQHIVFLIEGEMLRTTTNDELTYTVTELVKGPALVEPEQLYGPSCTYRSNYRTRTACKVLLISKSDVRETLMEIPIWRINLLNHYSSLINKAQRKCEPHPYNVKEQIMHFGAERPLKIHIRMQDLARYMGVSRTTISHTLHALEKEGKVKLTPNLIEFT